jgi:Kef-type K+ transport system membrane component KefB
LNVYYVAAIWLGMALLASMVSIWIAVPAALVEIVIGALAGNIPGISQHISQTGFVTFLASAGSLVLTFLAGAEIDPVSLRGHWKASLSIGLVSFLLPFLAAFGFCRLVLGWDLHAAEIGGIALSTTSVAVVYAVMVETGLNRHDLGKLILAACFITDLGTVLALGGLFASYNWLLIVFIAVSAVTVLLLPRLVRLAITRFGHRVSEPEIKLLLLVLFVLGGLATQAGSEAVLPAYVAGLVVAGVFLHDRVLMDRLRSIAFALLTPFFFLRAGTLISAPALISGAGVIAVLLLVKLAAKMIGVWPTASAFKMPRRERTYTAADGHRAHFRLHRRAVRPHPRPHRQDPVHRAGDRRHPVRLRADPHRPAALPARGAGHRGRGSARRRGPLDRPPPAGAARPGAARPGAARPGAV